MKKAFSWSWLLVSFMVVCCKNTKDEPIPELDPIGCLLKSTIIAGSNGILYETAFEYEKGELIRVNEVENSQLKQYYTYENNNLGQVSKVNRNNPDGFTNSYTIYEYNADKLPIKYKNFIRRPAANTDEIQSIATFEYNSAKQLVRQNIFSPSEQTVPMSYFLFTYDTNNNVTQVLQYIKSSSTGSYGNPNKFIYTYDNKKNPYYGKDWYKFIDAEFLSPNNIASLKATLSNTGFEYSYTKEFKYNNDNFPTERIYSSDSTIPKMIFNYTCE